jgi:hypothetical protein
MGNSLREPDARRQVPAIKVRQWLAGWEKISFSPRAHRSRPEPHFYVFSLPAVELRALCGISRRDASVVEDRALDLGIQRRHEPERSAEIAQFVGFGFPWSTLSEAKRKTQEFHDLRKPGWLPTAIVINILGAADERHPGVKVSDQDVVRISEASGAVGCLGAENHSALRGDRRTAPTLGIQ